MSTALRVIHPHAAGIDIGSEKIFVAVEGQPVKSFATFTASYHEAARYLLQHQVTTVAMEATGVYWIALYDILEAVGLEVWLVNPSEVKHVPGRKSDVQDCQWLQQLHSFGLLRRCFIPAESIRSIRSYLRLRDDHIQMAATHIQHIHKALDLMNIKLHTVISQITGVSGRRILDAILEGARDPEYLASLCDKQILAHKRREVMLSLEGNYREEHLFLLRHAYECWQFYQTKIAECDRRLAESLDTLTQHLQPPQTPSTPKPTRHHQPEIPHLHTKLMILTNGNDPARITGLTDASLLKLIGETGTDLADRWPTVKHFTSWLKLAPGKNSSGKRSRSAHLHGVTRAGQIFKQSVQSLARSNNIALGAFYRRLRAKKGPLVANKAAARKLAVLYYNAMTQGLDYVERGIEAYNQQYQKTLMKSLAKKAKLLNLRLVPITVS